MSTTVGDQKVLGRLMGRIVVNDETDCWEWQGSVTGGPGYGRLRINGREHYAHRLSYELHVGPIPEGKQIDHLCRVRHCVNPAHLEPVTQAENIMRGESPTARNALKTHCKNGHEYTAENTLRSVNRKTGALGRGCRTCHNARRRRTVVQRDIVRFGDLGRAS